MCEAKKNNPTGRDEDGNLRGKVGPQLVLVGAGRGMTGRGKNTAKSPLNFKSFYEMQKYVQKSWSQWSIDANEARLFARGGTFYRRNPQP